MKQTNANYVANKDDNIVEHVIYESIGPNKVHNMAFNTSL